MDPLLAAARLPALAERAMRSAIGGALVAGRSTPRSLVNEALLRFERSVAQNATDGVRPTLLFTERDRIVKELGLFMRSRLAARIFAVQPRDIIAAGPGSAPFDAFVRGRNGRLYAAVFRRLPPDGRRLERFRRMREAARSLRTHRIAGVLVYDLSSGHLARFSCRPARQSTAAWLGPAA
ncbi:MAG: hypothetical protein ACYDGM_04285 [Vulcanimicrobiaceae bacterium]